MFENVAVVLNTNGSLRNVRSRSRMQRIGTNISVLIQHHYLLLILFTLTALSTAFPITFFYGISFSFSSIFLFLTYRLYGFRSVLFPAMFTLLWIPHHSIHIAYWFLLLMEIGFVAAYFKIKKSGKMFFVDASFWFTLGILTIFLLNKAALSDAALYFQMSKDILNGLFNVLIADMLLAYFPFYKFIKSGKINKNNVSIHQLLSHITIISIMIPFFLIILTKTWNGYELFFQNSRTEAMRNVSHIKQELLLSGSDADLPGGHEKIENVIERFKSQAYEILITNPQNKVISATVAPNSIGWEEMNKQKKFSPGIYEAAPSGKDDVLSIVKWRAGHLVFETDLDSQNLKVFVLYPIRKYQDQVFMEFLLHLKLSIVFLIVSVVIVMIINKLLMNNFKQLLVVTTGLPSKVLNQETIEWPSSPIAEVRLLTANLKEMAQKLVDSFHESQQINKILSVQTNRLKESEDQLHKLAYYDALTSLPNRLHFQEYLQNLILKKPTDYLAVIFMDLNRFKEVNDSLGHEAGDMLLKMTGGKLAGLHNECRQIFRLGGDEFVIVEEVDTRVEINKTLQAVRKEFSKPVSISGHDLYVTGSCGISMYPVDGTDFDTLVKCADIAMYIAKEKGGNTAQFFDESMRDKFRNRLLIENSLRKTVDLGGFQLFYQPKCKNGMFTSLEALIRWDDSDFGSVSPALFIPLAEDIGVISRIDQWVLLKACRQMKTWQNENSLFFQVSVNVSAKSFQQGNLILWIQEALLETELDPRYLKIEITESVFIKNLEYVSEVISQIKALGVSVSIDDFGKGYSSLFHLLQLPIDEIKIDRNFIQGINQNEKQQFLVKSIIEMAQGLNLSIVAEGVETQKEKDILLAHGCDELQGYMFCPPLSSSEIETWVKAANQQVSILE